MPSWKPPSGVAISLAVAVLACSATPHLTPSQLEPTLSAAGFDMKPADTPEKLAALQKVTPFKLLQGHQNGRPVYFYADPTDCKCLFVGSRANYEAFYKLAWQQELADEHRSVATMDQAMSNNLDIWGPHQPWD